MDVNRFRAHLDRWPHYVSIPYVRGRNDPEFHWCCKHVGEPAKDFSWDFTGDRSITFFFSDPEVAFRFKLVYG